MWTSCNIELDNYAIVENKTKHWVQQTYIHCMGFATYDMYKQNFKFENSQIEKFECAFNSLTWRIWKKCVVMYNMNLEVYICVDLYFLGIWNT